METTKTEITGSPFVHRDVMESHPKWGSIVRRDRRHQQRTHAQWGARFLESPIQISEFLDGYLSGSTYRTMDEDEKREISTRSRGNIPTSWSRGFVKGFQDSEGPFLRNNVRARFQDGSKPYNEVVKELRERYPDEYPETDTEETVSELSTRLCSLGLLPLSGKEASDAEAIHTLIPTPGSGEDGVTAVFARWNDQTFETPEGLAKLKDNGDKYAGVIKVTETFEADEDGKVAKPVTTTYAAKTDRDLDLAIEATAPKYTFRQGLIVFMYDRGLSLSHAQLNELIPDVYALPEGPPRRAFLDDLFHRGQHMLNVQAANDFRTYEPATPAQH